jgi:flagellar biosynthesis GTPase FlhF
VATRQVRRGLLGAGVEVSVTAAAGAPAAAPAVAAERSGALHEADVARLVAPLRSELRSLRGLLRASETRHLEELRREVALLRSTLDDRGAVPAPQPLVALAASCTIAAPSQGRVVVLVGPTGVGKTTTIAKLAARAVYDAGRRVALVTTDTYRIGAEEQLRIFAGLIDVPVVVVRAPDALAGALARLADCDAVFVDTAGRSPRDTPAIEEMAQALAGLPGREVHLCVPAATPAAGIDRIVRHYRPVGIDRLLVTKLDEADDLAELVRAPARLGLPVSYVTTGQAVPEDLALVSAEQLVALARPAPAGEAVAA